MDKRAIVKLTKAEIVLAKAVLPSVIRARNISQKKQSKNADLYNREKM